MTSRLGNHFLRRLRHRLEAEMLDHAVEANILITGMWDVDGIQMLGYTANPVMLERTPLQIQRLVARLRTGDLPGSAAVTSIEHDGIVYSVDEDSLPPANTGAGRKRSASKRTGTRQGGDARYWRLTQQLLREVRCAADRPQAADVATLLLLARVVTESGIPLVEVLRVLRTPRPIITMVVSVAGFEGAFTDLLARGFVLPGKVAIASGYELSSASVRFSHHGSERWRAIIFPGIKFDPDDLDDIDKQVGRAALTALEAAAEA